MPLWIIYHPPSTFDSASNKSGLANEITKIYIASGLPPFYVNVFFQPIEPSSFYIGGVARPSSHTQANEPGPESDKPFIRITIQNIARTISNEATRESFLNRVDNALRPYVEEKGYDWEYSVLETSRDLWKIQGLVPPQPNSKAEKEWKQLNRAAPFKLEDGGLAGRL